MSHYNIKEKIPLIEKGICQFVFAQGEKEGCLIFDNGKVSKVMLHATSFKSRKMTPTSIVKVAKRGKLLYVITGKG